MLLHNQTKSFDPKKVPLSCCEKWNSDIWKLEYVWKHKRCLDPQIKTYGSVDFTLT